MKKYTLHLGIILTLVVAIFALTACGTVSTADASYWFDDYSRTDVAYTDDNGGNIDKAGTHWTMTAKKDMNVDIMFSVDVDEVFSSMAFTLNGEKILRDRPDMFNVIYKGLTLKKGDKLEFHGFFVNSIKAEEKKEGFAISMFVIVLDGAQYVVDDIK